MHWRKYKDIVARANVVCLEVVVEITRRTRLQEPVGRVDEIPFSIENMKFVVALSCIILVLSINVVAVMYFSKQS